jgi:hypothetical protein
VTSALDLGAASALPSDRQTLAGLEGLRRAAALQGPSLAVARVAQAETYRPRLASILASPSLVATPERFYAAVVQALPELVETRWAAYVTPGFESTHTAVDYLDKDTGETKPFEDTTQLFTFSGGVSHLAEWRKGKGDASEAIITPLMYAGISFRSGDSVRVPDEGHVCRPLAAGSEALECLDGPVGSPTSSNFTSFTAELRYWAYDQSLGLNPKYTYSRQKPDGGAEKIVKTFEVPIYFMHQVKDINVRDVTFGADLAGGVNVGWRDDGTRSGPFLSVFFTKIFGMP